MSKNAPLPSDVEIVLSQDDRAKRRTDSEIRPPLSFLMVYGLAAPPYERSDDLIQLSPDYKSSLRLLGL